MNVKKNYGGLDVFKLISAFLVVAIHTSPLLSVNAGADFFATRVLARLAVPFFFMVTGQFVLSDYMSGRTKNVSSIWNYLKKILLLYGIAILLYIPLGIYAGHYREITIRSAFRMLIFDGTFYHLWYFPALILGILLLLLLRRFCSLQICTMIAAALYLIGLFGDSYWGLISNIPAISDVYEFGFHIFTYTRNGLFFAPLFLLMGTWFHRKANCGQPAKNTAGFAAAFLLMTTEAFTLRYLNVQRHDSMYLALPVCMFFLYRLLLAWNIGSSKTFRTISTWIYMLHPAMIIVVRGAAKILHAEKLLIDHSLIHYITVCCLSVIVSWSIAFIIARFGRKTFTKDRAWIELDRAALRHNISVLRSLLPEHCALMPAVKANAYGHGAVLIAKELNQLDVNAFCVACIEEGIELRKHGIKGEILILGYTHPKQFDLLRRYHLTQTVVDYAYALELNRYGKKLHVHVGIDTGMRRLGECSEHIEKLCSIFRMNHLKVDGAFTLLCTADTDNPKDREFTRKQAQSFFETMDELKGRGISCPKIHLQSSYGVLNYPELAGDYARVGIALYGVHSTKNDYDQSGTRLQPVLSLKARIAAVKELLPGEAVGYGLTFTAEHPMQIATLTIGYADGLPRALSCGGGFVLINGRKAPIIGRICMDQTTVDITDIPHVHPGDTAILIGSSGEETISVDEIAEKANTITNEILSRMGARLKHTIIESSQTSQKNLFCT